MLNYFKPWNFKLYDYHVSLRATVESDSIGFPQEKGPKEGQR